MAHPVSTKREYRLMVAFLSLLAGCGVAASDQAASTTDASIGSTPPSTIERTREAPDGIEGLVVQVDDGDSIIIQIGTRRKRVRLIGINAPEQNECLGAGARQELTDLIQGLVLVLEPDIENADQFGRLLRYVWLNGELINETMASRGLAIAREYQPNLARQATLESAEGVARQSGVGVWASDACGPSGTIEIAILAIQSDPAGPDAENLNGEFVIFENLSNSTADLSGFGLRDGSSANRYSFPDGTRVEGSATFVVYVGCGADSAVEYYWCHDGPVWNNDGDEAILTNRSGNIVAYDSY